MLSGLFVFAPRLRQMAPDLPFWPQHSTDTPQPCSFVSVPVPQTRHLNGQFIDGVRPLRGLGLSSICKALSAISGVSLTTGIGFLFLSVIYPSFL